MNTDSLRRGNLVQTNQGVFKVHLIGEKHIEVCPFLEKEPFKVKVWEPIPLTEEWLLKFVFKKQRAIYYPVYSVLCRKSRTYFTVSWHTDYEDPNELSLKKVRSWWSHGENKFDLKIEYVHQLQNLYFGLTGEELTLK